MKSRILIIPFILIACAARGAWGGVDYFPDDGFLPGWKGGLIENYDSAHDLFVYMNGGAELYLEYRFTDLQVREYSRTNGETLTIEIFSFATPWDAWGIFSLDTTGTETDIGFGARKSNVSMRFWKSHQFVRIFLWQSKPESEAILEAAARAVSMKIPHNRGEFLPYLTQLRKSNLRAAFIRGAIALRQVASPWHSADITLDRTEGAAWVFPRAENEPGCLVLSYSAESEAEKEFERLWERIKAEARGSALAGNRGIVSRKDGSVEGLEKFTRNAISTILWVPSAVDEASCAKTLDTIISALSSRRTK